LVVGQAPAKASTSGALGVETLSGRRLRSVISEEFEAVNLLDEFPGKSGKGDAFPLDSARKAAAALLLARLRGGERRFVLLLGGNVAKAFGVHRRPILEWFQADAGLLVAVFPHPSGVNRWWNDAGNRERAGEFARQLKTSQRRLQKFASRGKILDAAFGNNLLFSDDTVKGVAGGSVQTFKCMANANKQKGDERL